MDKFPIKPDGVEQMVRGIEDQRTSDRARRQHATAWRWLINSGQFCIDNQHYQVVSPPDPHADIIHIQLVGGGPAYSFTWEMLAIALDQKRFSLAMYRRSGA